MAYWEEHDYTPFFLKDEPTHTPQEIRAEYSRIRSILMKRAHRLEDLGFGERADYMRRMLPKLADIEASAVPDRLSQAKVLLDTEAFSIKGIRRIEEQIQAVTGFDIPVSDILDFNDYMQSWRLSSYRYIIDTNTAVRLYYTEYMEIGGTFENFYTIYTLRKQGLQRIKKLGQSG